DARRLAADRRGAVVDVGRVFSVELDQLSSPRDHVQGGADGVGEAGGETAQRRMTLRLQGEVMRRGGWLGVTIHRGAAYLGALISGLQVRPARGARCSSARCRPPAPPPLWRGRS